MLAGLFRSAASSLQPVSYGRGSATLEPATDEQHTRTLLFPDPTASSVLRNVDVSPPLPLPQTPFRAGGFDDRGGLELDEFRDLRIIIAQDACADQDKPCVLFDTKTPDLPHGDPHSPETQQGPFNKHSRASSGVFSLRYSSTSQTGKPPPRLPNPTQFASHTRNKSLTISGPRLGSQMHMSKDSDSKDSSNSFLECMFGVSSSVKAGSSTKMHVISSVSSYPGTGLNISGYPETLAMSPRRRDPLVHSHSFGFISSTSQASGNLNSGTPHDVVVITRTFNVNLPDTRENPTLGDSIYGSANPTSPLQQTRSVVVDGQGKKPKLRETKTPAFAVSLVIQLPRSTDTRPASRHMRQSSRPTSNLPSVSTSYDSDMQSSWTLLDALPLSVTSSQNLAEMVDHRVEGLVDHWDVIVRALSVLEREASRKIFDLLKQADEMVTGPVPKTPKEKTMQRTNQRIVQLNGWSLSGSTVLLTASSQAIRRVAYALRIPRVVPGLGLKRGGHWLEEAREIARYCGVEQQNYFLYSLLTAFLGNHTEWLSGLGSSWHKKRVRSQQTTLKSGGAISSRTVIICDQRSRARRLVFLLASFLHGPRGIDGLEAAFDSKSSTIPGGFILHSPPGGQVSRKESLRRTINRKARDMRLNSEGKGGHKPSASVSSIDADRAESGGNTSTRPNLLRKPSETPSIRTTAALPIPNSDLSGHKTSATTTSTVTPNPSTPVPYFISGSAGKDSYFPAVIGPESVESIASADLARLLRANSSPVFGDSSAPSSASSKWGSLLSGVSGFWSHRPDSSASASSVAQPSPQTSTLRRGSTTADLRRGSKIQSDSDPSSSGPGIISPRIGELRTPEQDKAPGTPQSAVESTRSISIPPRLKVDVQEGVIDVDVNIPGFLSSSFDVGAGSPPTFVARQSPSRVSIDGTSSAYGSRFHAEIGPQRSSPEQSNVAGFLRQYHQDFVLQAVMPYPEIGDDIKASMSLEESPDLDCVPSVAGSENSSSGRWVNVCSTLIADVQTFTVKRLTLKRKIIPKIDHRPDSASSEAKSPESPNTPHQTSSREITRSFKYEKQEEMFSSELVTEFDSTLTEAIERALNVPSAQPSRAPSPSRLAHSRNISNSTAASTTTTHTTPPSASNTIRLGDPQPQVFEYSHRDPGRAVVGALEEVVKSVTDDLEHHDQGRAIPRTDAIAGKPTAAAGVAAATVSVAGGKQGEKEENALREGVKKWLLNIELTDVW